MVLMCVYSFLYLSCLKEEEEEEEEEEKKKTRKKVAHTQTTRKMQTFRVYRMRLLIGKETMILSAYFCRGLPSKKFLTIISYLVCAHFFSLNLPFSSVYVYHEPR